jgi:hypothetical protein
MKCEICGAEIPEGSLYCEKCGKDVHLVPDFTEFAVNKAEETVKNLISEVDDDDTDFGRSPEGANDERPVRKKESSDEPRNKYGWIRFALLAASVVVLAMVSLGFINRYSNAEYLLESARNHAESGDRAKAKAILEALEVHDSDDVDVLLYLAELYKEDGEDIKYENLLLQIIGLGFATSEQNAAAYEKLLAIYYQNEDYVSMADILYTCNNVEIKDQFVEFCLMIPEFSLESGYYGTDQILKISIPGNGRIYYTLDGTDPDENSDEYRVPLLLTKGEYEIRVCAVNAYGVKSPVTEGTFVIESEAEYETIAPIQGQNVIDENNNGIPDADEFELLVPGGISGYTDDGDVILSDGRRISPEELAAWILANTAPAEPMEPIEPDLEPVPEVED